MLPKILFLLGFGEIRCSVLPGCSAFVYEALLLLRLWMYRHGLITTFRPPVPVIAVGNLTVGGAGKTPVIEMLMRSLHQQQRRIVILSRGC